MLGHRPWQGRGLLAQVTLLVMLLVSGCVTDEERRFRAILKEQGARYPAMTARDVYKFVHHAAFGSAHAARDTAAVREWMTEEVLTLAPRAGEPLYEFIRPDSALVRVNLRPYLSKGLDPNQLSGAFIATGRTFAGSTQDLNRYWAVTLEAARAKEIPVPVLELDAVFAEQAVGGHTAIHHSSTYIDAYKPAYRVVMRNQITW